MNNSKEEKRMETLFVAMSCGGTAVMAALLVRSMAKWWLEDTELSSRGPSSIRRTVGGALFGLMLIGVFVCWRLTS